MAASRKMCCSDKLAMWNCVGTQGALLSTVLESPVYPSSITIGSGEGLFSHGALARAVCCRMGLQIQQGHGHNHDGHLNLHVRP
jgi:hypothetical protein